MKGHRLYFGLIRGILRGAKGMFSLCVSLDPEKNDACDTVSYVVALFLRIAVRGSSSTIRSADG